MNKVMIIDVVWTPIARYKNVLKDVWPDDLGESVIKALLDRNPNLLSEEFDGVLFGNAKLRKKIGM